MKIIELTRGYQALIDDIDYDDIAQFRWVTLKINDERIYAHRSFGVAGKQWESMHRRLLAPVPAGMYVDHIDGNGLNNQRANLRIVTPRQSAWNTKIHPNNRIGIKGISPGRRGKFRVSMRINGKQTYLGEFWTLEEARLVRQAAAIKYQGEYAWMGEWEEDKSKKVAQHIINQVKK